jgi:diguanylate cyclase (GGDEF)-like protein/PAS domain S-box-containing protein/putative nucleotidyltransferase with HDIG domain
MHFKETDSVKRIRISIQIAISLAMLSVSVLFLAEAIGLMPNERRATINARMAICENLAVTASIFTNRQQWDAVTISLRELKARNPDVVSAGLRRLDNSLISEVGNHAQSWTHTTERTSSLTHVYVPILQGKSRWGSLEVAFRPLATPGWPSWLDPMEWRLALFIAAANALVFLVYLGKVLYDLDPSRVMPERVRSAFDTLTEGLLVLDNEGRIVLANQAFAKALGRVPGDLLGTPASILPFPDGAAIPWDQVRQQKNACCGMELALDHTTGFQRTFLVNAAPIEDQKGECRGVLASFADITQLEEKKQELLKMLETLRESRDKIRQQNEELAYLATRDPLTGCLNRRSFFEELERLWRLDKIARISCLMLDIDKFKSINDRFGHSTGDEVLKRVAKTLLESIGTSGLVCRYGGEEFCIVLDACLLEHAAEVADILRNKVAALEFPNLSVTASFGVSCGCQGAASCQALIDQADKSLYHSKNTGRNRVTRWDLLPIDFQERAPEKAKHESGPTNVAEQPQVPYHAVACLLRALAYRDPETASHSARVADLAVATARGLMTAGEAYVLEIAALLHDIGKIGVPDAILLKPGPLSNDEWTIMNLHAGIGVEIVNSSFNSEPLVQIVRFHHAFFGGGIPGMPRGKDIPLGARIVSICDAYDAMVSNRVYRPARSPEAAFGELRRMAGTQFDPELVERFIEHVSRRLESPSDAVLPVSKELALHLGLQTERSAASLDVQDFSALRAIAAQMEATAKNHGFHSLAEAASLLQECAAENDVAQLVDLIHQVMCLSLTAQQVYLAIDHDMAKVTAARNHAVTRQN